MFPIFDSALVLFQPLAIGLAGLGAVAVAGTLIVVALVVRESRRADRPRATVSPIRTRLDKAA